MEKYHDYVFIGCCKQVTVGNNNGVDAAIVACYAFHTSERIYVPHLPSIWSNTRIFSDINIVRLKEDKFVNAY